MIRRISASDPRFKSFTFKEGLNLIVADTTPKSLETDSRNSAGKSSLVELLHFLLGARVDKHLVSRKALRDTTFELELDWPGLDEPLRVRRKGSEPNTVWLSSDVRTDSGQLDLGSTAITAAEWTSLIERQLFGMSDDHPGVSGRTLLSYLMRRASSHGFNEAIRSFSRQSEADATTNLSYLLGLDWRLASRYREISAREATRNQLRKAISDPAWGKIVGSTAELRGQITVAEQRVERLQRQIKEFRIVPEYENLKRRADELGRQIRQLANDDIVDQRNLEHLQKAIEDTKSPEVGYLDQVYEEVGILLADQIRRRFEEVENFHKSIVRNRRRYLSEEISAVEQRMHQRRLQRERLGDEQARILQSLDKGGALEALTTLQTVLAREQGALEALRSRYEAAQLLEASAREIAAMRLEVQEEMSHDLEERRRQTREATLLFDEFAERLYGAGRSAYLAIEAGRNSLKIVPRIDSDDSRGINNMVIFCFDLTLSTLAHRHNRAPDFLVHDSHLFDGVDARQLKEALSLARDISLRENLQYIATLNSDDLDKAVRAGFDAENFCLAPRLTDKFQDGGLFGFRFGNK